jgi:hypothetical protein
MKNREKRNGKRKSSSNMGDLIEKEMGMIND